MPQLPSSSSAGPSLEVKEPWQLTARSGASLLVAGMTLPVLVSVLTTVSVVAVGPDTSWGVLLGTMRVLQLASVALVLLSIMRLASAPAVDPALKVGALVMLVLAELGTLLPTTVLADGARAGLFAMFVTQLSSVLGTFAVLTVCRRIDHSLTDEAPWPLWGAAFVLAAGAALTRGLPLLAPDTGFVVGMVSGLLSLVSFGTMLAGVLQLRRRLA